VIIRVKTTLREALSKLPGAAVAWMIHEGWMEEWPLEITRKGRRHIQLIFTRGK
jgi:hypothetical protein